MCNYKFNLWIEPKDIYDKLFPEQKEQFSDVKIINANLGTDGNVEIECLAFESEIKELPFRQKLIGDWYITAKEH